MSGKGSDGAVHVGVAPPILFRIFPLKSLRGLKGDPFHQKFVLEAFVDLSPSFGVSVMRVDFIAGDAIEPGLNGDAVLIFRKRPQGIDKGVGGQFFSNDHVQRPAMYVVEYAVVVGLVQFAESSRVGLRPFDQVPF